MRTVLLLAGLLVIGAPAAAQPAPQNSCLTCHSTQGDKRLSTPTQLFTQSDIHRENGFACVDCHGGNAADSDKARSHDAARGFRGKPTGRQQIDACARCHGDAELMKRYAPKQRVDQAAEYATSVHGKRLAGGDTGVATCASCHGAHGIRRVSDAKSPVFPTNVANTCAACHASAAHMKDYKKADGTPLPTTQLADYQKSVHFRALTKGNDLSAPTCNDCHGNHGAAPPGVGSIAKVCGTCHAVFAQKFEKSVHNELFDKGCVECHSNHAILKPSDEMLSTSGHGVCATCHTAGDKNDKGSAGAERMRADIDALKAGIESSSALIERVKNAGIEVSDQELALREASTKLTLARTEMHAFVPEQLDPIVADGKKIADAARKAGRDGEGELKYRRTGLGVSLAAILFVVVALAVKIRSLDV